MKDDRMNHYLDRLKAISYIGIVTEIPFVDESSEQELLSLLGDWYEPESFESIFSSIASDAVFFSS